MLRSIKQAVKIPTKCSKGVFWALFLNINFPGYNIFIINTVYGNFADVILMTLKFIITNEELSKIIFISLYIFAINCIS